MSTQERVVATSVLRRFAQRVLWHVRWRVLMPIRYPTRTVRVAGFRIRVHSVREYIAQHLILYGGYETEDIATLCGLVKAGDTVVDVGANIGLHALHLSRAVGPDGRVIAFEPDPANLRLLNENIAANRCDNVTVHPYALGARDSVQTLYMCKGNKGFQSLARMSGAAQTVEVDVRRADEFLAGLRPSLMKMDVEGAEPLVLSGLTDWPDRVFFEFVPKQLRAFGSDPEALLASFVDRGFRLYMVDGRSLIPTTPEVMTVHADATCADHNVLAMRGPQPFADAGST